MLARIIYILVSLFVLYAYKPEIEMLMQCKKRRLQEHEKWDVQEKIFSGILFNIVVDLFVFLFFCVLSFCIAKTFSVSEYHSHSFNITPLGFSTVSEGKMDYGNGSIDGNTYYFFLRNYNGLDKIGKIPANMVYIKYCEEKNAHISVYKYKTHIPKWYWFIAPWKNVALADDGCVSKYVLTLPSDFEGNVEFKNDAKNQF